MKDEPSFPMSPWVRALYRRLLIAEAEASVRLDRDSDVHTCYEGHCTGGDEAIERKRAES